MVEYCRSHSNYLFTRNSSCNNLLQKKSNILCGFKYSIQQFYYDFCNGYSRHRHAARESNFLYKRKHVDQCSGNRCRPYLSVAGKYGKRFCKCYKRFTLFGGNICNLVDQSVPVTMNGYTYKVIVSGTCTPAVTSNTVTLAVSAAPNPVISAPNQQISLLCRFKCNFQYNSNRHFTYLSMAD